MKRRGSGEATGKVPARVELRKTAVGSDAQFARFVRASVVRAIRNGARTFGDLLLDMPSIYPTEALAAIDRMPRLPGVDAEVLGRIRADAGPPPQGRAAGGSLLPLPHLLDFEWRFSEETCRALLVAASEMTREGETILLYGTPGLAYAAISLPVRNRRVVFAAEDNAVTQRLLGLDKAAGRPIGMMVGGSPQTDCASTVLVDPPWYADYVQPMLRSASAACRADGVVLASLPPLGIRPGASEERDALERVAERQGLDRVALEELAISYETPFFEENALAAVGVYAPAVWRRGDLAVFRRGCSAFGQQAGSAKGEGKRMDFRQSHLSGGRCDGCPRGGERLQGRRDRRCGPFALAKPCGGGRLRCLGGPAAKNRVGRGGRAGAVRTGQLQQVRTGGMKVGTKVTAGRDARAGNRATGVDSELPGMAPRGLLMCFSGKIGSGKTSISCAVARWLECGRTSFGGYLRDAIARRGGDPDCRESLQDLGQSRIEQDTESFCRDVLAAGGFVPGEDFVLDAIRHVDVLPHLVRIAAPSEVRLIFVKADARLRLSRVGERSDRAREDFGRATGHFVEADMEYELPAVAHAVVDGSLAERDVIEVCIGLIDRWRWAGSCFPSAAPEVRGAAGRTRRK